MFWHNLSLFICGLEMMFAYVCPLGKKHHCFWLSKLYDKIPPSITILWRDEYTWVSLILMWKPYEAMRIDIAFTYLYYIYIHICIYTIHSHRYDYNWLYLSTFSTIAFGIWWIIETTGLPPFPQVPRAFPPASPGPLHVSSRPWHLRHGRHGRHGRRPRGWSL